MQRTKRHQLFLFVQLLFLFSVFSQCIHLHLPTVEEEAEAVQQH